MAPIQALMKSFRKTDEARKPLMASEGVSISPSARSSQSSSHVGENPLLNQRRILSELVLLSISSADNADMLNTQRHLISLRSALTLLNSSTSLYLRAPISGIKGHSLSIGEINALFVLHNSQTRSFRNRVSTIIEKHKLHKTIDFQYIPSNLPTIRREISQLKTELKALEDIWVKMGELEAIIFTFTK
jgi:hypothetical protein